MDGVAEVVQAAEGVSECNGDARVENGVAHEREALHAENGTPTWLGRTLRSESRED